MSKKTFSFEEAFQDQPKTFSFDEALEPSFGQQLLEGKGPDIVKPKKTSSVLEGTTLTPAEQAAPATGPSLAEVAGKIKERIPEAELNAARIAELEEKTRQYEEEVPFLQRQTDPLQASIARIPGYLPNLEVSSYQKEINKIRQGQSGVRDPISGEIIPFSPEEAENAIRMLQERQAGSQKQVMESQAEAGKYRKRPSIEAIGKVKTAREAFDLFQVDPFGVMASVSLESAPTMVPALVLGAVTRNPTVGALAMGSTSFATELSSGVTEYFQDNGVNINDPVAVNKALNDPVMFAKAYEHALTRASIIGTLDTASAGLASKLLVPKQLIKNQTAREAVNIGVAQPAAQMISGGGGEALAQIATEGSITKPGQVLFEAAGEGSTSILETAAFGGEKAIQRLKDERNQAPETITPVRVPPVSEGIEPELKARATMKWQQLVMDTAEGKKFNVKEMNKLARELGIEPSKNKEDTASAITAVLAPKTPAQEAPVAEAPVFAPVAPAPIVGESLGDADIEPDTIEQPQVKAPEPEIVQSFPMGENTEYRVIKHDQGYTANLYDKDAGEYVSGSTIIFPTERFGNEAELKATAYAKAESEKAAALTPQATEVVKEEEVKAAPVEPVTKKTVTDDEGEKIDFPLFVDMADKGYEVLGFENPRAYTDKAGNTYRTIEKDGIRIALQPNKVLFKQQGKEYGRVGTAIGKEKDVTFEHLTVDPNKRKQGLAKQAIQDLVDIADKNDYTVYLEPAQLEKQGMTTEQLSALYSKFGFVATNESGSPMVRKPGSKAVAPIKTQAQINQERQAEKKAFAERPVLKKALDIYELSQTLKNIGTDEKKAITDFTDQELVNEAKYLLGTFYEGGHANNDALIGEAGPDGQKDAKKQVKQLQDLIKSYETEAAKPTEEAEKPARKIVPQEFDQDEMNEVSRIVRRGNGAEYMESAYPLLKKMEKAGLIDLKSKGKVFISKEARDAGIKGGNQFNRFAGSEDMRRLEAFLNPEKKEESKAEEAKPEVKVSENKIFTEDAATKARNRLRSKLNQLNSGIDPEFLIDGITLSGYHIEKGARTFAAYSKAMISDLGDKVKPYLKQWYNAVRDDPSAKELVDDMDTYDQVQKASLPVAEKGTMDLMDPDSKFKIAQAVSQHFVSGNGFPTIIEARKFISNLTGKKIEPATADAKEADEAIEVGIVLAARKIAESGESKENIYNNLVDLYNRQPNLSVRSSTSIKEQAYSTPAPLAYIASQLAGIDKKTTVYEPSAGNGMLLIGASPKNVIANELNATRYEMLKKVLPDAEVVNKNALSFNPTLSDVVIANPPFGAIGEEVFSAEGFKTREIDHAISYKALGRMPANGRAVLIVGGVRGETEDARREGYRSAQKRAFYVNLYNNYNVVDHFTVDGDLYKKQGAAYPVDVIVINGKAQSERSYPAADLPKVYSSYEQLKEKLDEASRMESRPSSIARPDSGAGATRAGEPKVLDTGVGKPSAETGETRGEPRGGTKEGVSAAQDSGRPETKPSRTGAGREEPTAANVPELQQPGKEPVSSAGERVGSRVGASTERGEITGLARPSGVVDERARPSVKEEETQYQITYQPKSKLQSVETLMPKGMADAIKRALDRLEKKVGDIDTYVANSLNMSLDTLGDYFSAEQSDALALSIDNAQKGKGFIIGDQTGIGKGRVVAGMIKYAIENGKIPVFVTEKTNLYADMVRDLNAIGMADELNLNSNKQKVLITNSSSKDKIPYTFVVDEDGKKVEKEYILQSPKKGKAMGVLLDGLAKDKNIGDYKVIFTTYDQMKTVKKGATTPRREFLRTIADNNYIILDESHNAGGTGTPDPKKENVAKFARGLINNSYGSFFSSATYAKRANVMDLYASTDMSLAVENIEELAEAIQRGGVPMQQVVATMLAEAGQYIRREKSFEGITYETKEITINKEIAENMATTLRNVLSFSSAKESVVDEMQAEEDESGGIIVGGDLIPSEVEGDNFGATMHNLIGQMLLGLKAEQAANYAVERLKTGEKVVLTVSNTMGSFLNEYADEMGLSKGDPIDLTFKDLFLKYLNKQRIVKIKNEYGEAPEYIDGVKEVYLTDAMLGPKLTSSFNKIKEQIETANYGTAPISPIDYMKAIIKKAGYKSSEITGRNLVIDYNAPVIILDTRDSGIMARLNSIKEFNNADLDLMVLNRAGSTGLSLHSSQDFIKQNKRHMIVVQADADIAVHLQMLGRVNRTGQVNKPAYTQLGGDIPAENRPMAVLAKKMASLNANTTAGQKSALTAENVVDFVNEYGGQVAQEFLADNPWFNETIGNRIKVSEDSTTGTEDDIRKLTGYIPVFPIKQQEEIYQDLLDRYTSLIDLVNSMGTNKLEAKAMDLDAKTLSSKQITDDKGDSPFAKPAYMEQIDVKRTVKPLSSKEVQEIVAKNLDGRQPLDVNRQLKAELREKVSEYMALKKTEMLEKETDPIRINQFEKQTELTQSHIETILGMYKIGDGISLKDSQGVFTYGVITDIYTKGKTANPAAGSSWKMNVALANGEVKSLTLNFSQIGTASGFTLVVENIVDYFNLQTGQGERMRILDIFDAASGERREKRWMVTGNLLAGYAQYPGQIVFYRKDDQSVGQGILMSRQFDFEKELKEAPVRVKSAGQAMRFFEEIGGVISTDDNNMRIEKSGRNYYFITPKAKRQGSMYYGDEGLTQHTGTFYSSGATMRAVVFDEAKAEKAIQHLIDTDKKLLVKTGIEKARALFAPKLSQEEINQQRQADKVREGGDLYNNFSKDIGEKAIVKNIPVVREEVIKEYAELRKAGRRLLEQVAKYGSTVPLQRQLNQMLAQEQNLKQEIALTKPVKNTADDFMARATKALADGEITSDVEAFIRRMYEKKPSLLEGLRLSIKENKTDGKAIGNFAPYKRMVTLWRNTAGVSDPSTVRHEITHSLEQMMTPEAREAVITEWAKSLEKAMRENVDPRSRDYFDAVLVFLANPTKANFDDATNKLPSYKFYQYINPSEYWAVNAEELLGAKLGTPWQRFVNGVKALIEGLKRFFGFNNTYAIHQALNAILKGDQIRKTQDMLVDYISDGKYTTKFLNNIKDDQDLVDKYDMPEVPGHDPRTLKEMMVGSWDTINRQAEEWYQSKDKFSESIGKAWNQATKLRIETAWFAAGLDEADFKRYEGKIRTANNKAIAGIAIRNYIHAGYVSTEVLTKGKLEYSPKFGQFLAVESDKSIGNIIIGQAELRKQLGRQLADQIFQGYAVAHRTREIQNAYLDATNEVETLKQELQNTFDPVEKQRVAGELESAQRELKNIRIAYEKAPAFLCMLDEKKPYVEKDGKKIPNVKYGPDELPILNDEAIDEFIAKDKDYPIMEEMLDNWRPVNHNMLDNLVFSGKIKKREADKYKKHKYYVPWTRIMDEEESIYDSSKMSANRAGIKYFKEGRTERDIDNVVDSMINNVVMMTRMSIQNYAINRVAEDYGERRMIRDQKTGEMKPGRLKAYPTTGIDDTGVRIPITINGNKRIIKIPDHMVADAVLGMFIPTPDNVWTRFLSVMSNLTRRSITASLYFQLKQVFKDAPTAGWVSGVKSPFKVWGSTFPSFFNALGKNDETVKILNSGGVGGYRAFHRDEKKERAIELGLLEDKFYVKALKFIDKFGDASDLAPRVAIYKRVLKESGDPALAMLQASEIVDWQKHGKSRTALFLRSNVPFLQAFATQIDAFMQAAQGKGFKGKKQSEALQQFYLKTGLMFAGVGFAYAMAAASDDDYWELDDATRARGLYIPYSKSMFGRHVILPMNTTSAAFWKFLPELAYTYIISKGTKREIDKTRVGKMMFDVFTDAMLGPTPVPSAIKTTGEIILDKNTFTGGTVTPKSLKNVDAAEQYNASTSELGKFISSLTGTDKKRLLNPVEADHLMRGTFGTVAVTAMWTSNQLFGDNRPTSQLKENPLTGGILVADVQRLNENLLFDLRDRTVKYHETLVKLEERDMKRAREYRKENLQKLKAYDRAADAIRDIMEINKEIRIIDASKSDKWTPDSKRQRINDLTELKNRMLGNVTIWRRDAGL